MDELVEENKRLKKRLLVATGQEVPSPSERNGTASNPLNGDKSDSNHGLQILAKAVDVIEGHIENDGNKEQISIIQSPQTDDANEVLHPDLLVKAYVNGKLVEFNLKKKLTPIEVAAFRNPFVFGPFGPEKGFFRAYPCPLFHPTNNEIKYTLPTILQRSDNQTNVKIIDLGSCNGGRPHHIVFPYTRLFVDSEYPKPKITISRPSKQEYLTGSIETVTNIKPDAKAMICFHHEGVDGQIWTPLVPDGIPVLGKVINFQINKIKKSASHHFVCFIVFGRYRSRFSDCFCIDL